MFFAIATALAALPAHPLDPATIDAIPPQLADTLADLASHEVRCDPDARRKKQDAQLRSSLTDLVDAADQAQQAIDALPKGPTRALLTGHVYERLAFAIADSDAPSYLTPEQVEVYGMAIEDKAWAQEQKAVTAYEAALDGYGTHVPSPLVDHIVDTWIQLDKPDEAIRVARSVGRDADADRIEAAAADRAREAAEVEAAEEVLQAQELTELANAATRLEAVLGGTCAAEVRDEAALVLEQARAVLDAQEGSIAHDATFLVDRYVSLCE